MKNFAIVALMILIPFALGGCAKTAPESKTADDHSHEAADDHSHDGEGADHSHDGEGADHSHDGEGDHKHACACGKGKAGEKAWCDKCNVGYVDGKKVKCKGCYEAKTGGEACKSCKSPKAEAPPAES